MPPRSACEVDSLGPKTVGYAVVVDVFYDQRSHRMYRAISNYTRGAYQCITEKFCFGVFIFTYAELTVTCFSQVKQAISGKKMRHCGLPRSPQWKSRKNNPQEQLRCAMMSLSVITINTICNGRRTRTERPTPATAR